MTGELGDDHNTGMEAKIHVEEEPTPTSNGGNGVKFVAFNTEMNGSNGERNDQTSIEVQDELKDSEEIYPDKDGKTLFDRYYLSSGKPIPPYQGIHKVTAITWLELFSQQQLPAWRPVITPAQVVLTLIGMGVAMLAIGIACTVSTMGVVEVKQDYSQYSPPLSQTEFTNEQKSRYLRERGGFSIDLDMKIPKCGALAY